MHGAGETKRGMIRPEFNRWVMIDFQGAKIALDAGVLMLREVDERFGIIGPMEDGITDSRSPRQPRHTIVRMIRQRIYQIAAGYEDCNDADWRAQWRIAQVCEVGFEAWKCWEGGLPHNIISDDRWLNPRKSRRGKNLFPV